MASNEASMDKLLVTDLGPDITKEMIEAFFETRGMKIASVSVPENGQAIAELTSGKDIQSFLVKKHKIRQCVFNIELMENDDDRSSTIEVSYPEDLSADILEIYFQGPGPGGSDDKAIEWLKVIEPGKCHIKFESDEDAIAVSAEPKQEFMGKTLNVQRCLSSLPVKAKHDLDKLLVKGVPESVNEDVLTTYLDGRLDLEHETDYTVKLKNSCAVVIFTKQYSAEELDSFCEKISQGKLKRCVVSAERCNSIDVANILSCDKPANASSGTSLCSSEGDGYETDKLLIKDIPEAASSEGMLTVFIDGRLDLEHEADYTLIMLKDTCAVIVFKKKISVKELNAFSEKLSKGKIQGKTISAHKCQINSPETIEVNLILAAPPKQEYESDQLLITEIPDSVSEDYLATFLDGCLDLDHEGDDYALKMKRTCALVKFSQDYSVDELTAFCENVSSHKLKEETVTVEKCRVNCSILVTKIGNKEFKSQDDLQMYFQGKKSGAGKGTVESIVMLSADRAKVTFKEPSVVVAVLLKDHTKLGPNVSVAACSPLDGLDGSFDEEEADPSPPPIDNTPPKTMKPVLVPIDCLLAKFLQQKSELFEALEREIQMSVLLNDGIIELQPTESTPTDYSETSSKQQFQLLLSSKVCKADINIPPEADKDLYPMILKRCSSENLQMEFNDANDIISVAGLCESVRDLQKMAEQYCRCTIQTTGQHTLTGEEYRFFTRCSMKQVESKYKGVKIGFTENKDSFALSFSGSVHDVEQFQQALPSLVAHAKVPVNLSRLAITFLHKGKGFNILETIIGHASVVLPYFSADRLTLSLLCSHDDAEHAEAAAMKIKREIVEKQLELPPYFFTANVADSAEFNDFQQKTSKTYTFLCKVDEMKIKLVCRDEIIIRLSHLFEKFAAEECAITEKIVFKKGVWRLLNSARLEAKWNVLKEEMGNNEVTIVSSCKITASKPFVKVKGEHGKVEKIKEKILQLQKSIKEERITKCRPGMVRYFLKDTQGQILLSGIESNAKVCIEVEVETDEAELETSIDTSRSGTNFKRICSANTKGGFSICVYVGDITVFNRAEVIVNAANEDLHHGAGVAGAIFDRGGSVINKDSNDHVKKYGQVNTGSAVIFHRVGNLPPPYKAIVHAVGPRWSSSASHDKEIALLRKSVKNSLKLSQDYNSIAIPAISGGIFGFPPDISAGAVVKGVAEYLETDPDCNLTDINFVILQNNVDVFKKAMNDHFANVNAHDDVPTASLSPIATPSSDLDTPQDTKTHRKRGSIKPNMSLESIDLHSPNTLSVNSPIASSSALKLIKVTKGDILKNQCEVLVNTTDQQLGFGGYVGRVLLKAAGQGLADECEGIPKPIQHGDIVTTGAHKLTSKHMLHVVLPGYSGTQAETMLKSVVKKCLQECTRLKAKSISIPSIGAGNLGYPADVVATCLLEETTSYLSRNEGKTSLQLVHFVIFDGTVHQAFQDKYSQMESGKDTSDTVIPQPKPSSAMKNSRSPKSSPHGTRKKSSLVASSARSHDASEDTTCSFSLENGLLLQIVQGDITKESVDVVVNTTNTNMQLTGMGVAGALLKQGGPGLQAACDSLRKQNIKAGEGKVVETPCEGMGQLKCKSIFHIVFEGKDQRKLVKTILSCLDRAEKLKYTSIALPAIGTGSMAYSTSLAAEGIVKALKQFTQRKPRHVKQIRMVIFQPQMFQQFVDAFKKIEKTEGILNYIYDKGSKLLQSFGSLLSPDSDSEEEEGMEVSPSNVDSDDDGYDIIPAMPDISLDSAEVTLCIYGESETIVKRAVKQLTSLIDTTFITEEMDNEHIIELPSNAISALEDFAKQHAVDIEIDTDPDIHTIMLHGLQSDVLKVKDKVRVVLAEMDRWKMKEEAAATVCKHVKWVRQCSGGTEDYDEMTSFAIEQAFQQKKDIYNHDGGEEKFKIDFSKMEDIDLESGAVVNVQRIDFSQVDKPADWDPMPKDSNGREAIVHLVPLKQTSAEYVDTLGKFNMTIPQSHYQKIISIQRIQNPVQYGQYVARKKEMDKRNPPGCQNERWLFHGTKPDVVENINTQGFNRSFKNVTAYGQGVYFARDASYSNRYAQPGPNRYRHMYLTRVLTGEFTVGQSSMLVPPAKPNQQNRNVLYDSTVDNTAGPTIFVVYNDAQAYAAYLIAYQ